MQDIVKPRISMDGNNRPSPTASDRAGLAGCVSPTAATFKE